ncbi:MAG: undecaprenyl-diphosphate phosphatase [Anaerolineae bacterium]
MTLIDAIILGVIQGATEFLPISSSGHLVLLPTIFHMPLPDLALVGLVHVGSLMAVLIYFRRDLWQIISAVLAGLHRGQPLGTPEARLGWLIVAGSIPAAVVGFLLQDQFDAIFGTPVAAAAFLLVTAALLVAGERLLSGYKAVSGMNWTDALIVGLFQSLALLPGVSRSGSTIVGSLWRGLDRHAAARFSFLLGVPVIFGAGLLSVVDLLQAGALSNHWGVYAAAFTAAAVTGYLCITFLLNWLRQHTLYLFAAYCAAFGSLYLLAAALF